MRSVVSRFLGSGIAIMGYCIIGGLALMLVVGCVEENSHANGNAPLQPVINGYFANVYRVCDGTTMIYYAERYNAVALQAVKDGCNKNGTETR